MMRHAPVVLTYVLTVGAIATYDLWFLGRHAHPPATYVDTAACQPSHPPDSPRRDASAPPLYTGSRVVTTWASVSCGSR